MKRTNKAQLLIRATPELLKRVAARAKKEDRNKSQFVRRVLEQYLLAEDIKDRSR